MIDRLPRAAAPTNTSQNRGPVPPPPAERSSTTLSVHSQQSRSAPIQTSPPRQQPQSNPPKSQRRQRQRRRHQSHLQHLLSKCQFSQDHRARLPPLLSRFLGYRPPSDSQVPHSPLPIPPFIWLRHISLRHEIWIFSFLGSLTSILLVEAIMTGPSSAFRTVYHSPLVVSSFGASAVLVFGVIESPLAQPPNFVLGQFVSGLVGCALTRLWVKVPEYVGFAGGGETGANQFHPSPFLNGGLSMSSALLVQLVLSIVHPPGGATALAAATEPDIIQLSWRYLPVILASSAVMLGWALVWNNLGRRRYPIYWARPGWSLVRDRETEEARREKELKDDPVRELEGGARGEEALRVERVVSGIYDGDGDEYENESEEEERNGVGKDLENGGLEREAGSAGRGWHFAVTT